MYDINNLLSDEIPDQWIYKYYFDVKEPMDGRRIRIKSVFGNERTPSMFLYVKDGKYQWKDYSSGKSGTSPFFLLRDKLTYENGNCPSMRALMSMIRNDYNVWKGKHGHFKADNLETEFHNYELKTRFIASNYGEEHLNYWNRFGINQDLLLKYQIHPLKEFTLGKQYDNGKVSWFSHYSQPHCYGFFNAKSELIKIYNPYNEDFKHINIKKEVLGLNFLENVYDTLIITSSMKDMLTLLSLGLRVEAIAPISEKVLIPAEDIKYLRDLYTNILVLFDNDETGIKAMMLYKVLYGIDFVYVPYEKDLADFRATHSKQKVKQELVTRINRKINTDIATTGFPIGSLREPTSRWPE